jgi:hypothetical protein
LASQFKAQRRIFDKRDCGRNCLAKGAHPAGQSEVMNSHNGAGALTNSF